ncbi:MAG: MerR family transcriptional regulator [Clostridiales bacterium]|nr:MerR family transcriptional regulator [Clostridiales bacterium]
MYTIGQVAKFLNISRDTLKFYEEKGLVTPEKNDKNGYRIYSEYDIYDVLTTNYYRELDIEIKKIQEIRKSKSVEDVAQLIEEKEKLIADEIKAKQYLLKQLKKAKEDAINITKNLNVFSIIDMPRFIVKGEIADIFSFVDYDVLKTHTDNSKKAVTLSKLMRIASFDDTGIKGNRFVVVKETKLHEDETDEEIITHKKCLYTVVESGRGINKDENFVEKNDDVKIGDAIRKASIDNNCQLIGISYVTIVLTTYNDGYEHMFYNAYTPIV